MCFLQCSITWFWNRGKFFSAKNAVVLTRAREVVWRLIFCETPTLKWWSLWSSAAPCYFSLPYVFYSAWLRSQMQSRFCVLFLSCLLPELKHRELQNRKWGNCGSSSQVSYHEFSWSLKPGRNSIADTTARIAEKKIFGTAAACGKASCVTRIVTFSYRFWVRHKGEQEFLFVRIICAAGIQSIGGAGIAALWESCKICWECSHVMLLVSENEESFFTFKVGWQRVPQAL